MAAPQYEYGLMIGREQSRYGGSERIYLSVMRREPGHDYPLGFSDDTWDHDKPKHLHGTTLDGLCMSGFCSDSDGHFLLHGIEYREVFSMNERKLRRMVKTIARVNNRIQKDAASESGDKLVSFAAALKLTFVVERIGEARGGSYSDSDWRWMTVAEGRNRYRQVIEEATAATLERIGKKVAS